MALKLPRQRFHKLNGWLSDIMPSKIANPKTRCLPGRIIISNSFRVAKGLENIVGFQDLLLNPSGYICCHPDTQNTIRILFLLVLSGYPCFNRIIRRASVKEPMYDLPEGYYLIYVRICYKHLFSSPFTLHSNLSMPILNMEQQIQTKFQDFFPYRILKQY